MSSQDKRKLAAIMFADVVGYSRMMAINEERTLELLKDFENICSPIISDNQGEVVKKVGDELFCEFSSAKQAVDCALSIQEAIQPYNDSRPKDFKLQVRIGIHVGDIVLRDGDVFGDGVNVASRIQPFAIPGGICVSNAVRDAISSHPKYDVQSEGKHELKNIIENHTLYSIKTGFEDKTIINKYKKTNKTVPVLLGIVAVFIAMILFFGDSLNVWNVEKSVVEEQPEKYLIHLTSVYDEDVIKGTMYQRFLKGRELDTLGIHLLDTIRSNIKTELLSEYYISKKEFHVPTAREEIEYLNNNVLNIEHFGKDNVPEADSIYNRFNQPSNIYYINIFKFKQEELNDVESKYFYTMFLFYCSSNCQLRSDPVGITGLDIDEAIFLRLRDIISKRKHIGRVLKVNEDIVTIKLSELNIKSGMVLDAASVYDFSLDGFEIGKSDFNNAIKYYEEQKDTNNKFIVDALKKKTNWMFGDSIQPDFVGKTISPDPFYYKLRVIEIVDSLAISKIHSKEEFIKVRKGDQVFIL